MAKSRGRIFVVDPDVRRLAAFVPTLADEGFEIAGAASDSDLAGKLDAGYDMVVSVFSGGQGASSAGALLLWKPKSSSVPVGVICPLVPEFVSADRVADLVRLAPAKARPRVEALEGKQAELLAEICPAIGAAERDKGVRLALEAVARATGAETVHLMVADGGRLSLAGSSAGGGVAAPELLAKLAAEQKRPLLAETQESAPALARPEMAARGIRSALAIPLLMGENLVGVLTASAASEARGFDSRQVQTLVPVASLMAAYLETTRLAGKEKERDEVLAKASFSVDQRERELKALNALLQSQHGRMKALEENTHIDRERYLAVARFMAFSLESGSPDMRGHAEQVATWTLALSRSMNLNVEGLAEAAYLHDVGAFPAARDVLERLGVTEGAAKGAKGGPSTGSSGPAGAGTTADHCTTGEAIARLLKLAPDVGRAIRHHHENYDGSGYPDGLSGDRIPVAARLLRVAESYTDMVSEGVRKGRLTEQEAVGRMKAGMRKEYDPVIVEGLEKLFQKRERPSEGELLSTVSHELRSPLSFLVGYSELLASTHELPPAAKQAAQEIYSEASHMARLVEDMMDLSRLELGKAEIALSDIDLAALIERSVTGAKLKSAKHRVEADVPAALPPVRGNADRLMQVLDNLVDNAIKYSPDGGRVVVRAVARDGEVVVSVSDQGIGMPKDKLDLIFEKFQRLDSPLKNKVSGTGIGLNLCRHLVQAHGGRIWAESEEGKGSTLFFTIPVRR